MILTYFLIFYFMKTIKSPLEHIEEIIQELQSTHILYNVPIVEKLEELHRKITENSSYRIFFSPIHIAIIRKIFTYCIENKTHVIQKRNIPGLTHTDYGNFYSLQRFGLLYYLEDENGKRIKGGNWGVAVSRIYKFLQGDYKIAEYSEKNTATKWQETSENRVSIHEIYRKYKKTDLFLGDNHNQVPYFVTYDLYLKSQFEEIEANLLK